MNLNRRSLFAAAALIVPGLSVASAAATKEGGDKPRGVVIHVGANDPEVMNTALNNATNVVKYYADKGGAPSIEIVANGPGLHMFRADTSPVKGRLLAFAARMPEVEFSACSITKQGMESAEGKEIAIVPQAKLVPAGIVRLMERQEKGWGYVRP